MDSVTHTVLGACVGELIGGKKLGKKAMLWGALANNFPDIDVITGLWMRIPESTLAHRGFTHSFLFILLITPVAGYYLKKLHPKRDFTLAAWMTLWGVNQTIHILIDALTIYGTGWWEPFSQVRVSLNTIFVADPFYTIWLVIAAIALLVVRHKNLLRKKIAWTGIGISSLYMIYTFINKSKVDKVARENFSDQNLQVKQYFTSPCPLNNFLWSIVASDSSGFHIGYYSVFDKTHRVDFTYFNRNEKALAPLRGRKDVQKLLQFSQGYYTVVDKDALLVFNDLRFGQVGGWYLPNAPFIFSYSLFKTESQNMIIQQGRVRASSGEALQKMVERIKGK